MSMSDLAKLGGGKVAYIKVMSHDEAKELFPAVEGLPDRHRPLRPACGRRHPAGPDRQPPGGGRATRWATSWRSPACTDAALKADREILAMPRPAAGAFAFCARAGDCPSRALSSGPANGEERLMDQELLDRLAIRALVENWVVWRDAGDWERFRTVWHDDGRMMATWFQGTADEFIAVSRAGFDKGVSILHFLGGHSADLGGQPRHRADQDDHLAARHRPRRARATSSARAGSTISSRSATGAGAWCCASRSTRRIAWTRSIPRPS